MMANCRIYELTTSVILRRGWRAIKEEINARQVHQRYLGRATLRETEMKGSHQKTDVS
jgi:hypothetical protein